MTYDEFTLEILKRVKTRFEGKVEIVLENQKRLNGKSGLSLVMKLGKYQPAIYLEDCFETYKNGVSIGDISESICKALANAGEEYLVQGDQYFANVDDYNSVKSNVYVRIINYARNTNLLENVPHRPILNLAMVPFYYIAVDDGKGQIKEKTLEINMRMLKNWGISEQELMNQAIYNTVNSDFFYWDSIESTLDHNLPTPLFRKLKKSASGMYVLISEVAECGAVCVFLPGMAEKLYNVIGEEFYVLPSSIYETIFIPKSCTCEMELKRTVLQANHHDIPPEEILSDSVYFYNASKKRLEIYW